ncbi:hypothetical protein ZIOFF_068654 [Zingiber officinale]|uniref:Uncharacterized protein n=1 Tax=Zingiber officinale TaxID=94328 RepID=A0A8J5CF39_ZINOF|nr:hypothetical protein ZIOFF_068654 [Zingiber officinale]
MSGGQKQRIAIARAVLKSLKNLLLDEATSALDSESERIVQEALDLASVCRTTIIVSHRLSTIRHADVIVVVQDDRVSEIGSHDHLINRSDGLYSSLGYCLLFSIARWISQISAHDLSSDPPSSFMEKRNMAPFLDPLIFLVYSSANEDVVFSEYLLFYAGQNELSRFVGTIGDGFAIPAFFMFARVIFNDMGQGSIEAVNEGYCWSRTGEQQALRMRVRYLTAILRQDVEYFDLNTGTSSEVITSITSDNLVIQDCLSEKVPNFIMNCATFVGCYARGFSMIWRLTLVGSPTAVLLVIPGILYGRILMELARKMRREYQKAGTVVEQCVSSIRTVYSFVEEERTIAKFSSTLDDSVKLGLFQGLTKGLAVDSNGIIFAIMAFLVWALGSGLSNLKYFSETISVSECILEVIRRVPKIDSGSSNGEVLENLSGDVEFRNVEFTFPSRPDNYIFRDFNVNVPAGRTVALVGGSGSGKSTVIALLERFAGEILIDGTDIKRLQLKWLRSQIGLVSQEPALFATSIKENILFGKEDATIEEVVAAALAANAHSFISLLPQGYDTKVGERGAQMSGGQKQRIAIARVVLKSPKILLLDVATSALDSESERIERRTPPAPSVRQRRQRRPLPRRRWDGPHNPDRFCRGHLLHHGDWPSS